MKPKMLVVLSAMGVFFTNTGVEMSMVFLLLIFLFCFVFKLPLDSVRVCAHLQTEFLGSHSSPSWDLIRHRTDAKAGQAASHTDTKAGQTASHTDAKAGQAVRILFLVSGLI